MRSALQQAIDVIGAEAAADDLLFLACLISDLTWKRNRAQVEASPAWQASYAGGDGHARVRGIIAAAWSCPFADGSEPVPVLQRLGLVPPTRRGAPTDE